MTTTTLRATRLGNCARCFEPTQAVSTVSAVIAGDEYQWELCDAHADKYQRDMLGWTRVGRLVQAARTFISRRSEPEDDGSRGRVIAAHIHVPTATDAPEVRIAPAPVPAQPERPAGGTWAQKAARQVVGALPAGFEEWTFSTHALERQEGRGVSRAEALWCAAEPDRTTTDPFRPGKLRCYRGHVMCGVDPKDKHIITVINLNLDQNKDMRDTQKENHYAS